MYANDGRHLLSCEGLYNCPLAFFSDVKDYNIRATSEQSLRATGATEFLWWSQLASDSVIKHLTLYDRISQTWRFIILSAKPDLFIILLGKPDFLSPYQPNLINQNRRFIILLAESDVLSS